METSSNCMPLRNHNDVENDVSDNEEQTTSREDEPIDFSGLCKDQDELYHERQAIEQAVRNKQILPSRAKLQLWLYRAMRIVITDGRILIGIFLCTDSKANVILGACTEYTHNEGDERMIGLVMVPGEHIVSMHLDNRNINAMGMGGLGR